MPDLNRIRQQFPVFQYNSDILFDNPAGTQVAQSTLDRMNQYLIHANANHGGVFKTSQQSDQLLDEAREACRAFYNAARPEEIIFGQNMTTLTLHLSRSLAHQLSPGDKVVVTRLDHDANISPWVLVAEERGAEVIWVDFDPEDGTLSLESMASALESKPKLIAVGYASNALGTINPIKQISQMAHAAGALVYVDAVQYAPHGALDVQDLDCDFLVSSAYKYFGPHQGVLYGRYELLDELKAYKVRPASNQNPGKWETGTQSHEGIMGIYGALEHIMWMGDQFGAAYATEYAPKFDGQALRLRQGMRVIREHELDLSRAMLPMLADVPGLRIYGLSELDRVDDRVPTFAINLEGQHPKEVAQKLAAAGIYVWNGNYYALATTQRLGVEESGGMVRIGPVHYNTIAEVEKLGEVLHALSK